METKPLDQLEQTPEEENISQKRKSLADEEIQIENFSLGNG